MHIVTKEAGGAPMQTPRPFGQTIALQLDFGDEMVGADCNRAERSGMRVGDALVIHRHIKKSRSAERLARRLDFFQVAAERFLPLVEAEHGLKCRRSVKL